VVKNQKTFEVKKKPQRSFRFQICFGTLYKTLAVFVVEKNSSKSYVSSVDYVVKNQKTFEVKKKPQRSFRFQICFATLCKNLAVSAVEKIQAKAMFSMWTMWSKIKRPSTLK